MKAVRWLPLALGIAAGCDASVTIGTDPLASVADDCASDADCRGSRCVALTPSGFRVCAAQVSEATRCVGSKDECCSSKECSDGKRCYPTPLVKTCAPGALIATNVCAEDTCSSDASCEKGAICAPAGTLGRTVASCVAVACKQDADCTDRAGGRCAPVPDPCCPSNATLACVYPGACRLSSDCGAFGVCRVEGKATTCRPGPALCPLADP